MITPEEFPYITALHVNDCYTYKDFDIQLHDYKPFSHLILTGKNGSGKSTILGALGKAFSGWRTAADYSFQTIYTKHPSVLGKLFTVKKIIPSALVYDDRAIYQSVDWGEKYSSLNEKDYLDYNRISISLSKSPEILWRAEKLEYLYSSFSPKRNSFVMDVDVPTKGIEFIDNFNSLDSSSFFIEKFKQYLVNQKVEQAFFQIENKQNEVSDIEIFFTNLENALRDVLEGELQSLVFSRGQYEFLLKLKDERTLTFNTLAEGYSSFVSIIMDLFIRVDLIRKILGDYSYNPLGFVLIDEPETHLHLELQEQVLPLLTDLFPNIQFIVATHSPAVIASIKDATIFDLTTKETRVSEETVGRSYAELTTAHFGLENDYSTIADEYMHQVDAIIDQHNDNPAELRQQLVNWQRENARFLSPTLQVKLEFIIAQQDAKIAVAG